MGRMIKRSGQFNWLLGGLLVVLALPSLAETGQGVSIAPDGRPVEGENWLVLIAISDYLHQPSLRGPRADAAALKQVLLERYDFDSEHLLELSDAQATKRGIQSLFRDLGKRIGPEDSLLIYYAGHGHTDEFSQTGYWIPHDGGVDVIEKDKWLPNAEIRGSIAALSAARHVLLIADSCFAGDLLSEQRSISRAIDNAYFARAYEGVSRQVMTSGANEPVQDTSIQGHSAFAYHLVDTLRRNREPYLDPMQLYTRVRTGVSGQLPLLGALRGAGHQDGAAYLFFLRRGAEAGEVPAPAEAPVRPPAATSVSPDLTMLTQASKDFDHVSRELDNADGWNWFLQRYPEGDLADRARARLASLKAVRPTGHATLRLAAQGMGGVDSWRGVKTFYTRLKSRVSYAGAALEFMLSNWVAWPDRIRTEIVTEIGRETTVVVGSTGFRESGGVVMPLTDEEIGVQVADLNRAIFTLFSQIDNPDLRSRETGMRQVNGSECSGVEAVFRGETSMLCVAPDGRVLSHSFEGYHPLSGEWGKVELVYSDYRQVGRLRLPYHSEMRFNGAAVMVSDALEVAVDRSMSPALFEPEN